VLRSSLEGDAGLAREHTAAAPPSSTYRSLSRPLDPRMTTVIVAPLPEEMAALRRRLRGGAPIPELRSLRWARAGRLAGRPVVLAVSGDGEARAQKGVEMLLSVLPIRRLIVVGVAGGLSPELAAGAVVAARRVVRIGEPPRVAPEELARKAVSCGARPGVAITTRELVCRPESKLELHRRWAPLIPCKPPPPMVVDLESFVYATAAERAGVPWLVLRAVSDTAWESLPTFLERCRDSGGSIRRGSVVRYALLHPQRLPDLLRMARRVEGCAEALATCAERLAALAEPVAPLPRVVPVTTAP
jgi:adenosylhomocysteine nucleosidase